MISIKMGIGDWGCCSSVLSISLSSSESDFLAYTLDVPKQRHSMSMIEIMIGSFFFIFFILLCIEELPHRYDTSAGADADTESQEYPGEIVNQKSYRNHWHGKHLVNLICADVHKFRVNEVRDSKRQTRRNDADQHTFNKERPANEPVGCTDVFHDADFFRSVEHRKFDRIGYDDDGYDDQEYHDDQRCDLDGSGRLEQFINGALVVLHVLDSFVFGCVLRQSICLLKIAYHDDDGIRKRIIFQAVQKIAVLAPPLLELFHGLVLRLVVGI